MKEENLKENEEEITLEIVELYRNEEIIIESCLSE